MKIPKLLLVALLPTVILSGCKKDESSASVSAKISGSTWEVTYYWDKDADETYKFQSYSFIFNSDQTMEATSSSGSETGTWMFDTSDDSHDHFIIAMPATPPLDDLSDDWHVIRISDSVIELKDESGSGGTEYLTFKTKS